MWVSNNVKSHRPPPFISLHFLHLFLSICPSPQKNTWASNSRSRRVDGHICLAERWSLFHNPWILDLLSSHSRLFSNELHLTGGCAYTVAVDPGVSTATERLLWEYVCTQLDLWHCALHQQNLALTNRLAIVPVSHVWLTGTYCLFVFFFVFFFLLV